MGNRDVQSRNEPTHEPALTPAAIPAKNGRVLAARVASATILCGILALAAVLYQPWRAGPFPRTDFQLFLPALFENDSFSSRFSEMTMLYGAHGRFHPLYTAALTLTWQLYEWNTVGWQFSLFAVMSAVTVCGFALLRRFGATDTGAAAGSMLFVLAHGATPTWLEPNYLAEPLGTLLMLGAVAIALRFRESSRPVSAAFALAFVLSLSVFCKETMIAAVPFVLAVAATFENKRWRTPIADWRNVTLLAVCGVVLLVFNVVPVLLTRSGAAHGAYAASYSASGVTANAVVARLAGMFTPTVNKFSHPANIVFILVVVAGLAVRSRKLGLENAAIGICVAALLPLAGAAIYTPWPGFETSEWYKLPFLLGPALLLAWAVSALTMVSPKIRAATLLALVLLSLYTARDAWSTSQWTAARREVEGSLIRTLARYRDRQLIAFARSTPRGDNAESWQGFARSSRVSPIPPIHALACATVDSLVRSGVTKAVFIAPEGECSAAFSQAGTPAVVIVRRFAIPSVKKGAVTRDSVRTEIYDLRSGTGEQSAHRVPISAPGGLISGPIQH